MKHGRGPKFWVLIILGLVAILAPIFSQTVNAKTRVETNIFLPDSAYNIASLTALENTLGFKFNAVMWYQDWAGNFDPTPANNVHASGHIPELTWEPQANGTGVSYDAVNAGTYDSYLTSFAQSVKNLGYPIRLSLAPEMNTDWTPWGIGLQGNNAGNFKTFWQHVVQKFRDAGATNVAWVWSPNVTPDNAGQLYGNYGNIYPGDSFVDFMGLDGYNWGSSQSWSEWQSFAQVFQSSYQSLLGVSGKNILLMEISSAEVGGSKAAWITDMFAALQSGYARIQGFTWFDINKETDWRINSSSAAQSAFIAGYNGSTSSSGAGSTSSAGSSATSGASSPSAKKAPAVSSPTSPATAPVVAPAVSVTPAATASDPANQKYPTDGALPAKLAGNLVVSAATAKQLSAPEIGLILATVLAGFLAIGFLAARRYRYLHHQPPLPVGLLIEHSLGLGLVDSVFHRSRLERSTNQKKNHLR